MYVVQLWYKCGQRIQLVDHKLGICSGVNVNFACDVPYSVLSVVLLMNTVAVLLMVRKLQLL